MKLLRIVAVISMLSSVLFAVSCSESVTVNIRADELVHFIWDGDIVSAKAYLTQTDRDLDTETIFGPSLLGHAIEYDQLEIVIALIDAGANPLKKTKYSIDYESEKKITPLELASRYGSVEIVEYFLGHHSSSSYNSLIIIRAKRQAGYCSDKDSAEIIVGLLNSFEI